MEAALACTIAQHDEQEIAMIVTASVDFRDEKARAGGRYQSVWRKFVHAVVGPSAPNEGEILEYLYRHRYDLPPEVWIELERRHLGP
jgi:hypothetical protein